MFLLVITLGIVCIMFLIPDKLIHVKSNFILRHFQENVKKRGEQEKIERKIHRLTEGEKEKYD